MIKQLANTMTSFLVKENIITTNYAEIYQYGFEQIFINLLTFLLVALLAMIFHLWVESIFFFIGLLPIRVVAGGYHAKTSQRCSAISLTVFCLNMFLIKILNNSINFKVAIIINIFILIVIYLFAPVDHKNRVLIGSDYKLSKNISRVVALILVGYCIGNIVKAESCNTLLISIMMGALTASISLIIGNIKRGGERNGEIKILA